MKTDRWMHEGYDLRWIDWRCMYANNEIQWGIWVGKHPDHEERVHAVVPFGSVGTHVRSEILDFTLRFTDFSDYVDIFTPDEVKDQWQQMGLDALTDLIDKINKGQYKSQRQLEMEEKAAQQKAWWEEMQRQYQQQLSKPYYAAQQPSYWYGQSPNWYVQPGAWTLGQQAQQMQNQGVSWQVQYAQQIQNMNSYGGGGTVTTNDVSPGSSGQTDLGVSKPLWAEIKKVLGI